MFVDRHTFAVVAVAGLLAAVASGCTAHKRPSKVEASLANMAKDVVIPIEAEQVANPLAGSAGVTQQGGQIYAESCALCHGSDGHGRTDLGQGMYPPAMDLTSPHVQHWNDAELFWIIQNGVRLTGMPSWKSTLSDSDTWKLVSFIHALPELDAAARAQVGRAPALPAAAASSQADTIRYGKTLYRQEGCFMCHRLDGEGGGVGPELTMEGARGRTDAWIVGHFKDPPAYTPGSIMPPFKNLTDAQLEALTKFLQSQKGSTR